MPYNYYPQSTPGYFNANYIPQMPQQASIPLLQMVSNEVSARNAQFPMDGIAIYFVNKQAGEIYSKRLSMTDGY